MANVNKFHETLISPSNFKSCPSLESPSDCLNDVLCYFGWLFLLSKGVNYFTTEGFSFHYFHVDRLVHKIFKNVMLATFYFSLPKAPGKNRKL